MRAKFIKEDAMGGVSSPGSTLANVPGVGTASPAASGATTGAQQTSSDSIGSGDKWGDGDIYDQNGKIKKKGKKGKKKVEENNLNPFDKIGAMMAKKMGVAQPFKKKDSRTNQVKQETFKEAKEPQFKLPTLDQYSKAAEHIPVHPLETRKGKKMDEDAATAEQDSLKDTKAKILLKELGVPFIFKQGPSGKHRVYVKGDNINNVVKKIKELDWEEVGTNPEKTIKKFRKDGKELTIFADGKDLPRVTVVDVEETGNDMIESILSKKMVSNSLEPYLTEDDAEEKIYTVYIATSNGKKNIKIKATSREYSRKKVYAENPKAEVIGCNYPE